MVGIDQIKELREQTGISISECRKALIESGENIDRARTLLKEWGKEVAAKKQVREVDEGLIDAYLHSNGKVGVLIDVGCETDFVAKSDDFRSLVHELTLQVASMKPEDVPELLKQQYIKDSSNTVQDLLQETIAKLGENIVIQRFTRFEI
ncbi:translation elongation factor Ts [Patescibacteria group bacterium]|nr:translation elongation factor Ts [Patescibacteria group bacterium]